MLGVEQDALRLARETKDKRGEAIVLESLADSYWTFGNRQRALETKQAALDADRQMGTRNNQAIILKDMGDMRILLPQLDKAILIEKLKTTCGSFLAVETELHKAQNNWQILFGEPLPT